MLTEVCQIIYFLPFRPILKRYSSVSDSCHTSILYYHTRHSTNKFINGNFIKINWRQTFSEKKESSWTKKIQSHPRAVITGSVIIGPSLARTDIPPTTSKSYGSKKPSIMFLMPKDGYFLRNFLPSSEILPEDWLLIEELSKMKLKSVKIR